MKTVLFGTMYMTPNINDIFSYRHRHLSSKYVVLNVLFNIQTSVIQVSVHISDEVRLTVRN